MTFTIRRLSAHLLAIWISLFSWIQLSWGQITEIQSIFEIQPQVDSETWVLVDLDNTLIHPSGQVGSHQWFDALLRLCLKEFQPEVAYRKAGMIWVNAQSNLKMGPVEPKIPEWISNFRKSGAKVLALTARELSLKEITFRHLSSAGIDLSVGSDLKGDPHLSHEQIFLKDKHQLANDVLYSNGVIFAGYQTPKGQVLLELLKVWKYKPKKIIFVDDRRENVVSLEEYLKRSSKIQYDGYRLGAMDSKVASFNQMIASLKTVNSVSDFLKYPFDDQQKVAVKGPVKVTADVK